jgi:tyrosyl-tRNA synthetase
LHGAEAAIAAEATAKAVFEQGGVGEELTTITVTFDQLAEGVSTAALFVQAGLAASGKEAKRLFADGGAKVNDIVETAPRLIGEEELRNGIKLTAGKKRHALVKLG